VKQEQRDPNVSDEVRNALQAAIRAKDRLEEEQNARKAIKSLEQSIIDSVLLDPAPGQKPSQARPIDHRKNEEAQAEELRISQQKEAEAKADDEWAAILLREREKAWLKEESARRAREKAAAELQAKNEAEAKADNERAAILLREREKAWLMEQSHGARRARKEEGRRREQEQKAQQKLRELGVCSAGYRWIKTGDGYQCEGGSHFVSASALGL
jgi:hypothetical protein